MDYVNKTDSAIVIPLQDYSVIAIREAEINPDEWRPIEFHINSWCGNSYGEEIILEPGFGIAFVSKRMTGETTVNIRYKIRINGKKDYLYSEPFSGQIDLCRTIVHPDEQPIITDFIDFLD
ncbi:MAG: hypothetical protein R3B47_01615 [Bacteroidia bacterium]